MTYVFHPTHSDCVPANYEESLRAQEKGVETEVIDTQVHPALPWERAFPVATRVVWRERGKRRRRRRRGKEEEEGGEEEGEEE